MNLRKIILPLLFIFSGTIGLYSQSLPNTLPSEFWNDPVFVNRFLGSYGFLSAVEPKISEEETEMFQELLELMKVDLSAAAGYLTQQITPESSAALHFTLGNLYFQLGESSQAIEAYEKALQKFPDFRRAEKNVGLLYVQKGAFDKAIQALAKAVELGDRDGRSFGLLGYCYLNNNQYIAAEIAYQQAIILQPDNSSWKLGFAQSLLALEKYREAKGIFDILIAQDPEKSDYWLYQANTFLGLEEPMRAATNFEVVRFMGKAKPESLIILGDIYMSQKIPTMAVDAYLAASEDPDCDVKALIRAAEILSQYQAYAEATQLISRIKNTVNASLNQKQELKLLTLQARIDKNAGEIEKATQTLQEIVERDPSNGEALFELGRTYAENGDSAKAAFFFERARKATEWEVPALLEQAQMLVRQSHFDKAVPLLRQALSLKPNPNVENYLRRVERASRILRSHS